MIKILHNVASTGCVEAPYNVGSKRDRSVVIRCRSISFFGDMLAISQSGGITPVLRNVLKISVMASTTSSAE